MLWLWLWLALGTWVFLGLLVENSSCGWNNDCRCGCGWGCERWVVRNAAPSEVAGRPFFQTATAALPLRRKRNFLPKDDDSDRRKTIVAKEKGRDFFAMLVI